MECIPCMYDTFYWTPFVADYASAFEVNDQNLKCGKLVPSYFLLFHVGTHNFGLIFMCSDSGCWQGRL